MQPQNGFFESPQGIEMVTQKRQHQPRAAQMKGVECTGISKVSRTLKNGKPTTYCIPDAQVSYSKPGDKRKRSYDTANSGVFAHCNRPRETKRKLRIDEPYLRDYLMDTLELSEKNIDRIMGYIKRIQHDYGITEPSRDALLDLKTKMRAKPRVTRDGKAALDQNGKQIIGLSSATIKNAMWSFRYWGAAYKIWAVDDKTLFAETRLPKVSNRTVKVLDYSIAREIIHDESLTIRDRALFVIFLTTACRISEVANIKTMDIDHKSRTISIRDTKNGEDRIVTLSPPEYYNIVKVYCEARADELGRRHVNCDSLFISDKTSKSLTEDGIREAIYRIRDRYGLGVGELYPHMLRHTACTKLNETIGTAGMLISGHKTPTMWKRYSDHSTIKTIQDRMDETFRY